MTGRHRAVHNVLADEYRDEVLYGRSHDHARVFISSRMRRNLDAERAAAAGAVDSVSGHRAWWWEQDAPIGVLHSEAECIKFAGTSATLILLVAGELSEIVQGEYRAAREGGADRYILIREGDTLPEDVREFVDSQRHEVVTRNFANVEELRTHIIRGLERSLVRSLAVQNLARRETLRNSNG